MLVSFHCWFLAIVCASSRTESAFCSSLLFQLSISAFALGPEPLRNGRSLPLLSWTFSTPASLRAVWGTIGDHVSSPVRSLGTEGEAAAAFGHSPVSMSQLQRFPDSDPHPKGEHRNGAAQFAIGCEERRSCGMCMGRCFSPAASPAALRCRSAPLC